MNEEDAIRDIYKKIDREKALIQAASMMRGSTDNPAVRSRLDSQMRDGQRNITFFEQRLQDLQQRLQSASLGDDGPTPPPKDSSHAWPGGSGGYGDLAAPRQPFAGGGGSGGGGGSRPRPNFSKLGGSRFPRYAPPPVHVVGQRSPAGGIGARAVEQHPLVDEPLGRD